MAAKRRTKTREPQLAFEALSIEGGLLSPEWLSKVAQLQGGTQAEADYGIPKGLNLRDEIGRYWRIAQAHWGDFKSGREAKADAKATAERFVLALLRDAFGFAALVPVAPAILQERTYPIGHATLSGRVPVVVAPADSGLDTLLLTFGDGARRRSAFGVAQEYLNAQEGALWGIASDGVALRIVRDNASLTRPAWIEADLDRIFTEERYADFAALWLLCHETRFGRDGQPVTECALEIWRSAGREEGTRAREHLRRGVEEALVALGQGFLWHAENAGLRAKLQNGTLPVKDYFNQLLRLVYRLIFLLTVEERGLLHPDGASDATKALYANGYGIRRLRERSVKRSAHDRFADLWDATKVVCRGLAAGEPLLGLPALAGIFAANQCPALDAAKLENRALLLAVFKLAWLRTDGSLSRVNWRDMGPEELGSVYESLLELVPQIAKDGRQFAFATGGETKGNARKTTGSYYTPDSLVQVLLDSALEPVISDTIAKNPGNAVDALLSLSIVDPACGSGHFLLAAARRLAAHVARLQANGTPSTAEYRHALRQVVGRCIFGVDLNPMAVELCKVGLWMEAVEPGLPLTFLNSHIQHGNALLGTTPELMAKGIPDAAWNPIEGDDKKTASALRKRNKKAAEGQRSLDTLWAKPADTEAQTVTRAVAELDAASDANVEALARKEERWDGILGSPEYRHQKFVADAWCAAFVWPKQLGELADAAPTNELWRQLRDGQGTAPALTARIVGELAEQYRFFHWHLQFPQVFAKGGFDAVLSNPPWDRITIEEKEWFATTRPDIANASTAAARRVAIKQLEQSAPELFRIFKQERRRVDGEKAFISNAGRTPLSAQGILNTYPAFVELALGAVSERGRVGIIVPTGIATAKGAGDLFRDILDSGRLRSLRDLHNRKGIFPAVQRNMRFCLLTLSGNRGDSFVVSAQAADLTELHDPARLCALSIADVKQVNPETHHLPLFARRRDAEIIKKIYDGYGTISAALGRWPNRRVDFLRMLNTADDSEMFEPFDPEEFRGAASSAWLPIVRNGRGYRPLYEAKLLDQYNHRAATFVGTDREKRYGLHAAATPSSESDLNDPQYVSVPRYWVPEVNLPQEIQRPFLLVYRDAVSAVADARCLSAAFVPWGGVGDTLKVAFAHGGTDDLVVLVSVLNSFVVDYVFRQKSSSSHASAFILRQLPIPEFDAFARKCPWAPAETLQSWFGCRQLELNFTAHDLAPFARSVGYGGPPFRWIPERRADLVCEIDAALLTLFNLVKDEASDVLDAFPIVRRRDEERYGEYRTKRVILEIYDAMAEAVRTGTPYKSRLDPPPADLRVAHPSREGGKVIPLQVKPATRLQPFIAPAAAVVPDLTFVAAGAWTRPHAIERGEIQAAILAVLKANAAPMDRRQGRLAALFCLEPHLLGSMLDKKEEAEWARVVGGDAKKAANASINATAQEWGAALSQLRGRERLVEDLQQNTWALGTGTEAIDTSGWPEGRAGFVVNVLRRLQQSTQVDAIILKLPTTAQQWLANAA